MGLAGNRLSKLSSILSFEKRIIEILLRNNVDKLTNVNDVDKLTNI